MKYLILGIFVTFASFVNLSAQESHEQEVHPHHAGIFLGGTTDTDIAFEFNFTLGIDYEYRFIHTTPNVGVGVIGEIVMAEHTEYIAALPLFVHPWQGLKVYFAPGYITASAVDHATPTGETPTAQKLMPQDRILAGGESNLEENVVESNSHFFVRFGAGYDFHYQQFSITPTISADIIESTVYVVYGVGLGIGF